MIMAARQPTTVKPRKRGKFPLNFPRIGDQVELQDLWFQWTPPKTRKRNISYRLMVYQLRPGQTFSQAAKGRPVYQAEKLETPHHKFPEFFQGLDPQLAYCWRVEARDEADRPVGRSEIQGFRFRPPNYSKFLDQQVGTVWWSDKSLFLPTPPTIWGRSVIVRPLSSLPEEEPLPPEGESGTLVPSAFTLWGSQAATLYLIPSLFEHAHIWWDYSHISGCEGVLLQTTGWDGFEIPNALDARADAGVRAWYEGPVALHPEECGEYIPRLAFLGGMPPSVCADNLNLQSTEEFALVTDLLHVRLVPLDAAGNQIGPASDHVSVHYVDYPEIELESCEVEWLWGETPRRHIHFTIRLQGRFPSTLIYPVNAPTTFIIKGSSSQVSPSPEGLSIAVENIILTEADGTNVTLLGTWYELPAYFKVIDQWEDDARYTFTLEQSSSVVATGSSVSQLFQFTELQLNIDCIPGLNPYWQICKGRLLDDDRPPIGSLPGEECVSTRLSVMCEESGLEPIYQLFTQPLTGRRVSSRDGDQEVQVRFEFTEEITDPQGFRNFLYRSSGLYNITMVESIADSSRTYEFRMTGFHAIMQDTETLDWYKGESNMLPGRLVFDPPRLEMYFQSDRSYWIEEEARFVEDIETVEYLLAIEE
jgi:hypothetical protein